jgi:hypothetical protein
MRVLADIGDRMVRGTTRSSLKTRIAEGTNGTLRKTEALKSLYNREAFVEIEDTWNAKALIRGAVFTLWSR